MALIVSGRLHPFTLGLRAPLQTARGRLTSREGVLLVLEAADGTRGYGEACPIPGFAGFAREDAKASAEVLSRWLGFVQGARSGDRDALLDRAESQVPTAPAARFALDTALVDLEARAARRCMADWLAGGRAPRRAVPVNVLVQASDPEAVYEAGRRAAAAGFDTFKLKLGARDLPLDLARVAALRRAVGAGGRIRLDANAGFTFGEAREALQALAAFAIEYVEDPLVLTGPADTDALACLRSQVPVAIAVDESAGSLLRVQEILAREATDFLVLKPSVVGGLRAARRLAAEARARGVTAVVTSGLDAAVGLTAALHLAASLDGPLPACGLATAALLESDLARAPAPRCGRIALPAGPGLGVVPAGRAA